MLMLYWAIKRKTGKSGEESRDTRQTKGLMRESWLGLQKVIDEERQTRKMWVEKLTWREPQGRPNENGATDEVREMRQTSGVEARNEDEKQANTAIVNDETMSIPHYIQMYFRHLPRRLLAILLSIQRHLLRTHEHEKKIFFSQTGLRFDGVKTIANKYSAVRGMNNTRYWIEQEQQQLQQWHTQMSWIDMTRSLYEISGCISDKMKEREEDKKREWEKEGEREEVCCNRHRCHDCLHNWCDCHCRAHAWLRSLYYVKKKPVRAQLARLLFVSIPVITTKATKLTCIA